MLNRLRNAAWAFRQSPNISLAQLDEMILGLDIGERDSDTGERVSEEIGTRQATVYSCINILSRDMSALPKQLFERQSNGGRRRVPPSEHRLARWLDRPNDSMTAYHHRAVGWAHTLSWGNAYYLVDSTPRRIRTWPLEPPRMEVSVRGDGRKRFRYHLTTGETRDFDDSQILHNYGLSFNGWQGVSPIRWNMRTIGRAIAVGQYAASYFNSPVPRVIAEREGGFKDGADYEEFKRNWNEKFAGKRGMKTIAVLPNGLKVGQILKIPNDEAQFIETSKFTKEELAQIYLMPLHRLQALDRATFSNIEHQDLEYVKYTLLPWLKNDEEAIERMFLSDQERERLMVRHNVEGLLRGDFKTRMEGHAVGIQWGFRTRNEARALENDPAVDGLDEPLVPLNMGPASQLGENPAEGARALEKIKELVDGVFANDTLGRNAQPQSVSRNGSSRH